MWSCRGVGLTRVLAAIRVRSGPVRLVFESPNKYQKKKALTAKQIKAKQEAAEEAQRKKDALLSELETDEKVRLISNLNSLETENSRMNLTLSTAIVSFDVSFSTRSD